MKTLAILAVLYPALALATVNVNTAQQSELQRTQGLDKYKAKSLIEYRAQNGDFRSLADLEKVPGFSRDVVEKLRPQLALEGDPYVPPKPEKKAKK